MALRVIVSAKTGVESHAVQVIIPARAIFSVLWFMGLSLSLVGCRQPIGPSGYIVGIVLSGYGFAFGERIWFRWMKCFSNNRTRLQNMFSHELASHFSVALLDRRHEVLVLSH